MRWTKTFRTTVRTWGTRGRAISAGTRKAKLLCKRLLGATGKPGSLR